ncbi:hypothetical protein OIU85_025672 [Salix viminalis]|uniref:Uncharacterized protein n=1 Tax=Salix viminalis TaxID=40686 RepID=A0A9Q0TM34_SALVM|nr:hypothetical protein OIU85_025672 [Salix viminalis]
MQLLLSLRVQRTKFKANVTVKRNDGSKNKQSDWTGGTLRLELVLLTLIPEKCGPLLRGHSQAGQADDDVLFEAEFEVPPDYGEVGAVFVTMNFSDEAMFIKKNSPLMVPPSWPGFIDLSSMGLDFSRKTLLHQQVNVLALARHQVD